MSRKYDPNETYYAVRMENGIIKGVTITDYEGARDVCRDYRRHGCNARIMSREQLDAYYDKLYQEMEAMRKGKKQACYDNV